MKNFLLTLLPLIGLLLLVGCEKEAATPRTGDADSTIEFRSDKVTVCHYTGSETNPYEIIEVADQSWIKAHQEHGDAVDMDGDGYFDRENGCRQIVDCDDNDPNVYQTCVPTVVSKTGRIWMDRNLGATRVATSPTDAASYGDLYQWGRGADGHQLRNSATTTTLSSTDQPGYGDFIKTSGSGYPYDWRSPQNDNLWQGVNGTNNPCPAGFRLPTIEEWEQERATWSSNDADGAIDSPLKLPMAGLRNFDGPIYLVGTWGLYWSSTVSDVHSSYIFFTSSNASMSTNSRGLGFAVRCIKD